jgi:sugar phosphate isomerase/epimerase
MTADRDFAAVGDGTLDMPAICAAAAEGGVRVYVVENDRPRSSGLEESARRWREHGRAWGLTEAER